MTSVVGRLDHGNSTRMASIWCCISSFAFFSCSCVEVPLLAADECPRLLSEASFFLLVLLPGVVEGRPLLSYVPPQFLFPCASNLPILLA